MEARSEVELMVELGRGFPQKPPQPECYEMALKRFEFEFPTIEARRAYVQAFASFGDDVPTEKDERIRQAFRFWFERIWPNLPKIRNHPSFLHFRNSQAPPLHRTGQVVVHRYFGYRGVIVSIDRVYRGTEEWYAQNARSLPPKNRPWYRILVDQSEQVTYVAERHLQAEASPAPVDHPLVDEFFGEFTQGQYSTRWRKDDPS